MSKIKIVPIEKTFDLSPDEKDELARQSMELTDAFDKKTEEFKDSRADFRRQLKIIKTAINEKNKAYREGLEKRTIDCQEHIDLDQKKARYLYDGKVISERDLTMDELALHGTASLFEDVEPAGDAQDLRDVIASEKNVKKKRDLVAT